MACTRCETDQLFFFIQVYSYNIILSTVSNLAHAEMSSASGGLRPPDQVFAPGPRWEQIDDFTRMCNKGSGIALYHRYKPPDPLIDSRFRARHGRAPSKVNSCIRHVLDPSNFETVVAPLLAASTTLYASIYEQRNHSGLLCILL